MHSITLVTNYCILLQYLQAITGEKYPWYFLNFGVSFLQANVPCTGRASLHHIHECDFTLLLQSHYSPDLAPLDFHLFSTLKHHLKGQHFHTDDVIMNAVRDWCKVQEIFSPWIRNTGTQLGEGDHTQGGLRRQLGKRHSPVTTSSQIASLFIKVPWYLFINIITLGFWVNLQ